MARISKDRKIKVNSAETKYAIFNNDTVVLNDDYCNVWGYNKSGEFWFQKEHGEPVDEPYLTDWWYKCAVDESNEENHNEPLYFYKWVYRCIAEYFTVETRSIWHRGSFRDFTVNRTPSGASNRDGQLVLPLFQFFDVYDDTIRFRIHSIIGENCSMIADNGLRRSNDYFVLSCPSDSTAMNGRLSKVNESVAMVDAKILELYGFSPTNKPQTVDEKVKVAKVIYDWLLDHNVNGGSYWENQCAYAAFSRGEYNPICFSWSSAVNFLFKRYGIENVFALIDGHVFNLVNYHDEIGEYTPNNDNEWCIIDLQKAGYVPNAYTCFNMVSTDVNGYYTYPDKWSYPTTNPSDDKHRYDGDKKYEW